MLSLGEISFGIEFETCFCINEDPAKKPMLPVPYKKIASKLYAGRLTEIAKEKDVKVDIRVEEDPRNVDYNKWTVTVDPSIRCAFRDVSAPEPTDRYYRGGEVVGDRCKPYSTSVELVTPTYKYNDIEYKNFTDVLSKVVFAPEFTYTSNVSQGMHVNISHPNQDFLKTLEMWWYFEEVMMLTTPIGHRGTYYVRSIRNIFPTIESLREGYLEFYKYPDARPAKYTSLCKKSNRFEFRMVPAAMSNEHVLAWLGFCARFVAAAVTFEKPAGRDSGDFEELFAYIRNDDIKRFFLKTIIDNYSKEYESLVPVAKEIRKKLKLSAVSVDTFKSICRFNLLPINLVLTKTLEEGNFPFLETLVEITGSDENLSLDLRYIIDRWDDYFSKFRDMLMDAIGDKDINPAYTLVVYNLSRKPMPVFEYKIPFHYEKDIEHLKIVLAAKGIEFIE